MISRVQCSLSLLLPCSTDWLPLSRHYWDELRMKSLETMIWGYKIAFCNLGVMLRRGMRTGMRCHARALMQSLSLAETSVVESEHTMTAWNASSSKLGDSHEECITHVTILRI